MCAGGRLRRAARLFGFGLMLALCLPAGLAAAQVSATPEDAAPDAVAPPLQAFPQSAILILDQDRLFVESAFGKASLARERALIRLLEEENSRIEADLIAEEQDLTTRRATLPAEEFAALARDFDAKVERIRNEQDTKARDLTRNREEDRQAFLRAAVPVLGDLMREKGAVAILEKSTVILSLTAIDVTDEAITRVDTVLPLDVPPPAAP